jgi:hypothetical protein
MTLNTDLKNHELPEALPQDQPLQREIIASEYADTDPVLIAKMKLVNNVRSYTSRKAFYISYNLGHRRNWIHQLPYKAFLSQWLWVKRVQPTVSIGASLILPSSAVDSILAFIPSITASNVVAEFNPSYTRAGQLAVYVGLFIGSLFWGLSANIVGRKWAFNLTLIISAIFGIVAGSAPNYESWVFFNVMMAFGAGGNLVLDTTVFLEYLPSTSSWLVVLMAAWWGVGQTIAGLVAWGFLRE